ncbi:hypothetical protein CBL_09111 [Carabus blaptoides fortunei]
MLAPLNPSDGNQTSIKRSKHCTNSKCLQEQRNNEESSSYVTSEEKELYWTKGLEAALLIREKQRLRRKKRLGRGELPSHVATKEIAPFPRYPPGSWQEEQMMENFPCFREVRFQLKALSSHSIFAIRQLKWKWRRRSVGTRRWKMFASGNQPSTRVLPVDANA